MLQMDKIDVKRLQQAYGRQNDCVELLPFGG